jgi:hypothetical protein
LIYKLFIHKFIDKFGKVLGSRVHAIQAGYFVQVSVIELVQYSFQDGFNDAEIHRHPYSIQGVCFQANAHLPIVSVQVTACAFITA